MTRLVAVMVAISRAVFGPGAIRAPANCAVPADRDRGRGERDADGRPAAASPAAASAAPVIRSGTAGPGGPGRARASLGRAAPA